MARALITWLTRALPFFGGQRRLDALARPNTPLSVLGPSLLAATAVIANLVENTDVAVQASILAYSIFLAAHASF